MGARTGGVQPGVWNQAHAFSKPWARESENRQRTGRTAMKLFFSYPSAERGLAERLTLALEAEGHEVFIDRADLKAGEPFHQRLREAIQGADAMIFLVTPESVAPGSYALAELNIAQQRWRRPGGHVLPVMVVPTPMAALPAYLSAVTVLQPRGETVAEVVAAVAQLRPQPAWRGRWMIGVAAAAMLVVGAIGFVVLRQAEHRAAEQALMDAQRQVLARAITARELCVSGGYTVALAQLNELANRAPVQDKVLDAREDCAMVWLRDMRATVGKQTFGEQVAQAQPVLLQGLSRASGARAADLRAHIGWGEYLRGRDGTAGITANPVLHWKRALADDAGNVYAHAMWGRQLLDRPVRLGEAQGHFVQAVASGRNRGFVRGVQLGGSLGSITELATYALTVANEMRRGKEPLLGLHRERFWSHVFASGLLGAENRSAVLGALPPPDLLATYTWLFPAADVSDDRRALWRFNFATLQANNGNRVAARNGFESLVDELRAGERSGRLLDEAQRSLDRLSEGAARGASAPKPTR
ncbi:MAG TPA: toll/interleukin-1 receptor domain-containing protein [Rubrivivax sp.]